MKYSLHRNKTVRFADVVDLVDYMLLTSIIFSYVGIAADHRARHYSAIRPASTGPSFL